MPSASSAKIFLSPSSNATVACARPPFASISSTMPIFEFQVTSAPRTISVIRTPSVELWDPVSMAVKQLISGQRPLRVDHPRRDLEVFVKAGEKLANVLVSFLEEHLTHGLS